MATANEQLSDALVRHQTFLLRFARGMGQRAQSIIKRSNLEIEDIAKSRLAGIKSIDRPSDWNRVQTALKKMQASRDKAWKEVRDLMNNELRDLARQEPEFTIRRMQGVLPVKVDLKAPTAARVDELRSRPVEGRTIAGWITSMKTADKAAVRGATISATSEGTPLLGGLRNGFSRTSRNLQSVSKTLTTDTAQKARQATLEQNDVARQEEYIAVLDSRTTLICSSLDGKLFAVGNGPKPPLHVGCRSIRVAVLARDMLKDMPLTPQTEKELASEFAKENGLGNINSRADLPHGFKGKFDKWAPQRVSNRIGPPAKSVSYQEFLERQTKEFQVDTLGPTRAALFRKGDVTLDKFVDSNGEALTLDALAKRVPEAFDKI